MEKRKTYEELEETIRELEARLHGQGNREYKSRLFGFLFGREENKTWTLSLYNALRGTSHKDTSAITINTMEDVVYMGMKNDLSILVSETVNLYRSMELYEQQSSFNPNMPVREFMYAGKLYDKFIHEAKLNRYGRTLLPLPLPKLIVFYNGEENKEDRTILSLSDAFKEEIRRNIRNRRSSGTVSSEYTENDLETEAEKIFTEANPDIEVRVTMLNINHGRNQNLLTACRPLGEYAWFVAQVRKNHTVTGTTEGSNMQTGIGNAIDKAIDEMPDSFEIKKFIMANRAEVKDMCLTEYNEMETMELFKREGIQEGIQKGTQETRILDIRNLIDSTGWAAEKAMDLLKVPQEQRPALFAGLAKKDV